MAIKRLGGHLRSWEETFSRRDKSLINRMIWEKLIDKCKLLRNSETMLSMKEQRILRICSARADASYLSSSGLLFLCNAKSVWFFNENNEFDWCIHRTSCSLSFTMFLLTNIWLLPISKHHLDGCLKITINCDNLECKE